MGKKGNGLGATPVEIRRKGRPNTWGVRTPLHFDRAMGKKIRYWIGREYKTKTAAAKALRDWFKEYEGGQVRSYSEQTLGEYLDGWLENHRRERTTVSGFETKMRLHVKPHIGKLKLSEVTDEDLDGLYRMLETAPCPTNGNMPLGPKSVRHVHNILSGALGAAVPKLIPVNPAATAHPPTERQVKAREQKFPSVNDHQTRAFIETVWSPCGNSNCGPFHRCLRDAPLWTSYAATGCRRSEVLGWKWDLVNWDEGSITLGYVVVSEANDYYLRPLTKDGDDAAVIYVDQALMNVLRYQWERQQEERAGLGPAWVDHGLVFPRDGYMLRQGGLPGGPQDPEKVTARWRRLRNRLGLPEGFRLHDWRASKITNDLEAKENPVEVSANARHHSPGYTMEKYGRRRSEAAKKLAASTAGRIGLSRVL